MIFGCQLGQAEFSAIETGCDAVTFIRCCGSAKAAQLNLFQLAEVVEFRSCLILIDIMIALINTTYS
jgi:hypothetical protein